MALEPIKGSQNPDLSLETYIAKLKDYKAKAEKVFQMGDPKSNPNYVLKALEDAISVAQGKKVNEEQTTEVLRSAEDLTTSALNFHNKFAKVRESIEQNENKNRDLGHEKNTPGPRY